VDVVLEEFGHRLTVDPFCYILTWKP
jgi:hypothetical protein